MVSIIIPARNERFLNNTINDLLLKAKGDIEVIVNLDGYWPDPIISDKRVRYIHQGEAKGMRNGINAGVAVARGDYILKLDAHCMMGEGFDEILKADCDDDWVVIPRRKRLDADNWAILDVGKPDVDYMYLSYPSDPNDFGGKGLNGKNWDSKNKDKSLRSIEIDDVMSGQGSGWFMKRSYFEYLELMDEAGYGTFWNEMQEIGLKCWLSGGQMKVNKRTWYAHLHKGKKYGRGYTLDIRELSRGRNHTIRWFTEEKNWHKQTKPLRWLIEKFSPVPTWPEDKALWTREID